MSQLEVMTPQLIIPGPEMSGITNDVFANAHDFYKSGMKQYEHLIIGEDKAKRMFIAALLMGRGNVVVSGIPGGGKSTLLENAHSIVAGIEDEHVAIIPHRTDLTPAQLVGDNTKAVKETIQGDGSVVREEIGAMIQAMLTTEKKVVQADEITRGNPYTINAVLGILAKRSMSVNGVQTKFNNIELVASALNPEESLSSSFRAGAALASRQTFGAQLGNNTQAQSFDILDEIFDNSWEASPEKVEKIITLRGLHAIRAYVPKVIIGDSVLTDAKVATYKAMNAMAESDNPSKEAIGRLGTDIRDITKTLALLRGNVRADEQDVHDALEYRVTGPLTMRGGNSTDVENAMNAIYS